MLCPLHRRGLRRSGLSARSRPFPHALLLSCEASAIVEFAITLPLLVVFVVGIYDFSGAFDQKLKVDQAAQEGAIIAGSQPTTDVQPTSATGSNPDSLQAVVAAIFNSLAASGVLVNANNGTCTPPGTASGPASGALTWTYKISGCSNFSGPTPDLLQITINRAVVVDIAGTTTTPAAAIIGTSVNVQYPYHWRFNSVIQLLLPGASYAAVTQINETATVHNQM
jgi:Flp pilus assembly protein TadG